MRPQTGLPQRWPVLLYGMDPITLTFYATVCACLSAVAPRVPRLPVRLAIGALVGLVAATLLPFLRAAAGI
ncbi:hypothetical protein [Puniceibacterium sediminis]|uniref:Uncharacterized protein n=1 Tax=Puniceibacterium sediminis TaxID=1608407 RepID=A0A238VF38_9RHOB|nr:hypothetical protein [Puniceibacterium sediminis]SNR32831.1 hypothetical protein SAMN06265370_10257 [Puniceibacterium sediminis]